MPRTFIAIDLSEACRKELRRFVSALSSKRWPVRWEVFSKLHLTLFFLGSIQQSQVKSVSGVLAEITTDIKPFTIRVGKLGVFPDFIQPRAVWLGIKGDQPRLVSLQKLISQQLVSLGFEKETRIWIPHLTIGRVRNDSTFRSRKELGRQLGKLEIDSFIAETYVDKVVLYQSTLKPTGSEYTKLFEASLSL